MKLQERINRLQEKYKVRLWRLNQTDPSNVKMYSFRQKQLNLIQQELNKIRLIQYN